LKWDAVSSILKQTKGKHQRALKLKSHFAFVAGALGDSIHIRFGIFVVYQFHHGT
jgi:hypothetical protein